MANIISPDREVVEKVHEIQDTDVYEDAKGVTIYYSEDGSEALMLVDLGAGKHKLVNVYRDGQFTFATEAPVGEAEEV